MSLQPSLLGEYLIQNGLVEKQYIDLALTEQKLVSEKLGTILLRYGAIKKKDLKEALLATNPDSLFLADNVIDIDIPRSLLLELKTQVVADTATAIYIATLHDDPNYVVERIKHFTKGRDVLLRPLVDYEKLASWLALLKAEIKQHKSGLLGEKDVNKIIDVIIDNAINEHASDIHIQSGEYAIYVRYRVDGILRIAELVDSALTNALFSRIKGLCNMDISQKRVPQDGNFQRKYRNRYIDFRVSSMPISVFSGGENIVIRILDKDEVLVDIQEIGITKLVEWQQLSTLANGIILVCGSTGEGKTTTLYSTISDMDVLKRSIQSIENPIEYRLPFISQSQLNEAVGMGYPEFLKHVLRQDPDVIILGEIRDEETAKAAFRSGETGHLVYSTLHTNDAPTSIIRLENLKIDRSKIAFSLRGILVQKLVRKLCKNCQGKANGCEVCKYTRYKGRTLVAEFAKINGLNDVDRIANKEPGSYHSFFDDIQIKIRSGVVDYPEIDRVFGIEMVAKLKAAEKGNPRV